MRKVLEFSDLLASDKDKSSTEFGLKVANAISSEWFNGGMINPSCQYGQRRDWIKARRMYALGRQPLGQYKDVIAREKNDLSYLNLDWRPMNILGKFNKIVSDGINEEAYDVTVKAIDNGSIKSRKEYEESLRKNMYTKKYYQQVLQHNNIDLRPQGFVPEDNEELEIHLQLKPKEKIEIAEEVLIDQILKSNDFEIIKPYINADLVNIGIGGAKIYTDKVEGIKVRWVDPEYLVHSNVNTPYFKEAYYFGELRKKTLAELKREGQLSNKELNKIASQYADVNNGFMQDYSGDFISDSVLDYQVDVLEFTFKTTKDIVYKKSVKNKGTKYSKKNNKYNPPKRNDYGRVDKTVNIWYEGCYVVGTDFLYNYQESENVAVDNLNKVLPNYIMYAPEMYKGVLTSFSSTIEPIADKMLYTDLKLQHLIAEIKPNGAEINMDKLYELAADTKANQSEILSLFAVKGVVLSKTITDEGGQEYSQKAVQPIVNGVPNNIMDLVRIWEHYYNVIREITGVNPFRDGTQKGDTLVGVQKLGLLQSNIATKFIVRGSVFITKKSAECITSRVGTIFKYSPEIKKIYEDAIGQQNVNVLESLKDRHIHSFGIIIEMRPTDEEIIDLNNNISLAIQQGNINVEDKIQILNYGNIKKANNYLRYRSKKRREQLQEDAKLQAEQTAQSNAQATQVAAEEARKTKVFEMELEIQKEAQLSQIRIQEKMATSEIEAYKDTQKYNHEQSIAQIKNIGDEGLTRYKEDEKTKRQDRNNSQHSKMISQRKEDGAPIDFENEFKLNDIMNNLQ